MYQKHTLNFQHFFVNNNHTHNLLLLFLLMHLVIPIIWKFKKAISTKECKP